VTTFNYDVLGRRYLLPILAVQRQRPTTSVFATEVADEGNGTRPGQKGFTGRWAGRLVSVCEVSGTTLIGTNAFACSMRAGYFGDGISDKLSVRHSRNLTGVSQGGLNSRAFVYDSVSELTRRDQFRNPRRNISTRMFSAALCSGRVSDVCRRTDARGITTTYQYDQIKPHSGEVLYRWHTRSYVYIRRFFD